MTFTLKAVAVTVLSAAAVGSFAAWSASANTGGHLVSNVEHTLIKGGTEQGELQIHGMEAPIVCWESGGEATITSTTVTEVTVLPYWHLCETKNTGAKLTASQNGCHGRTTFAPGDPATTEQTADLVCPLARGIDIEHPSCRMSIPPQNNIGSGTSLRVTENGKHAVTAVAQAEFTVHFHEGICIFLGTKHTGTAIGSALIRGFNTAGEQVSITTT